MSMLVNPFMFGAGDEPPLGISDLQLWIDASQETGFSNGDEVTTAQDWSGNNRDATGLVNSVLLPTYRATDGPNSLPAFRCQNISTLQGGSFTLPNFLSGSAGHHFTVVKLDIEPILDARSGPPLGDWGTASSPGVYANSSDGIIYSQWGSTIRRATANPPALTNWHVYEERTAANDWSNWFDGTMLFQTFTNTVAWGVGPEIGRCNLGGVQTLYGMIAEVIFYNRVLTGGEVTAVYDYLNTKYAFSLP
jgi:hypothetical protein